MSTQNSECFLERARKRSHFGSSHFLFKLHFVRTGTSAIRQSTEGEAQFVSCSTFKGPVTTIIGGEEGSGLYGHESNLSSILAAITALGGGGSRLVTVGAQTQVDPVNLAPDERRTTFHVETWDVVCGMEVEPLLEHLEVAVPVERFLDS